MQRKIIITAAVFGMSSVIIGAWAAHGIQNFIPDADVLKTNKIESFKTGVRYQVFHTILILILGITPKDKFTKHLNLAFLFTVIGVVLFSGSIYLLALKSQIGLNDLGKVLGPITPIGGMTLILAWGMLLLYGLKMKKK